MSSGPAPRSSSSAWLLVAILGALVLGGGVFIVLVLANRGQTNTKTTEPVAKLPDRKLIDTTKAKTDDPEIPTKPIPVKDDDKKDPIKDKTPILDRPKIENPKESVFLLAVGKEGDLGPFIVAERKPALEKVPSLVKGPAPALLQPRPHPGVDQVKVDRAIEGGVKFLKAAARQENLVGARALAGLTLLHCGVAANDPVVQALARDVRTGAARLTMTYEIAACIWFFDQLGQAEDAPRLRSLATRLLASQGSSGGWAYGCHLLGLDQEKTLWKLLGADWPGETGWKTNQPALHADYLRPASPSVPDLSQLPVVRYRPGDAIISGRDVGRADNSLTQFAVLALWVSQKHGVPAQRALQMAEARYRGVQQANGTWTYLISQPGDLGALLGAGSGSAFRDTATCAGLIGLAPGIQQRQVDKKPLAKDPAIERPLQYLAARMSGLKPLPLDQRRQRQAQASLMYRMFEDQMRAVAKGRLDSGILMEQAIQVLNLGKFELTTKAELDLTALLGKARDLEKGSILAAEAWGDLYFLWSLERVGVVYDLTTIGPIDWYAWGVPFILGSQEVDGSWRDTFPGVPDTCFALLFLRRANLVPDLTVAVRQFNFPKEIGVRRAMPEPTIIPGQSRDLGLLPTGFIPAQAIGGGAVPGQFIPPNIRKE